MAGNLRIALIVILSLSIILSCTFLGNKMTDPATYSHTIEVLDKNRTTVLALTAASAAASAAVSTLPDDYCTPISEQLSEITSWFVVILGFIYLEKYLLTILGAAACYLLIPLGCGALLITCFFPKSMLQGIGMKLLAFGMVLLIAIPAGVWVSDQINAIYAESISITVQSASAVSDNLINEEQGEESENTTVIDKAKSLLGDLSGSVAGVIQQFKNMLNRFIEATAVMVVTTCIIPILIILFFIWVVKTLFSVPVSVPTQMLNPRKRKHPRDEERELIDSNLYLDKGQ